MVLKADWLVEPEGKNGPQGSVRLDDGVRRASTDLTIGGK